MNDEMPLALAVAGLLLKALKDKKNRRRWIVEFQRVVWNTPEKPDDHPAWEVLGDLAVDLDYYEPRRWARRQSASFYGDEEAEIVLRAGLRKLRAKGLEVPVEGELD